MNFIRNAISTGLFIVAPSFGALTICVAAHAQAATPPAYLNPALALDQRVDDLLSRMTLEEKTSQLANQSRAIPRLGVPEYDWWSEGLHGVAFAGRATVFPQAIALAATWDAPLLHSVATVLAIEARAKHHEAVRQGRRDLFEGLSIWAPNINIFRDPRWGRGQETYGEDPFLTGRMGVAFVTGMQGDDPKYLRVVSTPKHFAVHSGPEPLRHIFDVDVSKHDLEDTYLEAFRATVVEGHAGSVMCAYNAVKGTPACASDLLLKDHLRGQWGFDGYVVSDCEAVGDIYLGHHFVTNPEEAAAAALKAGMDNDCTDWTTEVIDDSDYGKYLRAVKRGLLTEADIDRTVKRLLRARFRLGMFDPPEMVAYARVPYSDNDSEAHREQALKSARESIVLLKNTGILPLTGTYQKIAVIGPLADSHDALLGNYNGTPSRSTSALEGLQKMFPGAEIAFAPGTHFLRDKMRVPSNWLATAQGKPGLDAEYYGNPNFQGAALARRVEPAGTYDYSVKVTGMDMRNMSARWSGRLIAPETASYRLGLTASGTAKLWLDGKQLADILSPDEPVTRMVDVMLEKGHAHTLKLEYSHVGQVSDASVYLQYSDDTPDPLATARAAMKTADLVIAAVGITADLEGEEGEDVHIDGFFRGDRTSLDLPKEEEQLIEAAKASSKPLVIVLMNGSALSVNWADQNADAILEAWYPGEEGGAAIAETLAGANNPAGRLPVTFYRGIDQLPLFENYEMQGRTYRYFEGKPLYPFGYGLSYSKFSYGSLHLSADKLRRGESLQVDADVTNSGERDGDEVAQLYLVFPALPGAPLRALRGFERVHLAKGQTRRLHFMLDARDLSMVNENGERLVAPGEYAISVGGGQPGTGAPAVSSKLTII